VQNEAAVGCEEISTLLGSTVKLTKAALKARYAAERPSAENASYDLFDPARIYQWGVAIHRVRTAYAHAHNGRKLRLLRPRRFTEKMQAALLAPRHQCRAYCGFASGLIV
jgi:hypothetical protein